MEQPATVSLCGTENKRSFGLLRSSMKYGDAGWSSPVARQAHNLKVAGSNPAPATNLIQAAFGRLFCCLRIRPARPPTALAAPGERLSIPSPGAPALRPTDDRRRRS